MITEGVFANALRTLTIAEKCQNLDRGIYRLNITEQNNHVKEAPKLPYQDLKEKVKVMIAELRGSFGKAVKDVDVFSDSEELVQYILKVRTALDRFEKEIEN